MAFSTFDILATMREAVASPVVEDDDLRVCAAPTELLDRTPIFTDCESIIATLGLVRRMKRRRIQSLK